MTASGEAVGLYRKLAADVLEASNPNFAGSLRVLSECLDRLGKPEGALVAVEEAVVLYCALAAARPEAFKSDFAASLVTLATILSCLVDLPVERR